MGGAPAGLGDPPARFVVARDEVGPVQQLIQAVVERYHVVTEKLPDAGRAGDESQQSVAAKPAHALGGIEMDRG